MEIMRTDDMTSDKPKVPAAWPSRKKTVASLTKDFAEGTSMHGLPKVVSNGSLFRRTVWAAFVLAALGLALYQLTSIVRFYISSPVSTVLSLDYNAQLTFPAVTICNLNPIRLSQLQNDSLQEQLDDILDVVGDISNISAEFPSFHEQYLLTVHVANLVSDLQPELRRQVGHQLEHMLLSCQFSGEQCHVSDFTYHYNSRYGNCFTYNHDMSGAAVSSKSGPQFGLAMELYVQEEEYVGLLANTLGFKVTVHDQAVLPFPEDEGVAVSPGTDAQIGISRLDIHRAKPPYGACVNTGDDIVMTLIQGWGAQFGYSDKACVKACLQISLIGQCGCCDAVYHCDHNIVQMVTGNISATARTCYVPYGTQEYEEFQEDVTCSEEVYSKFKRHELGCSERCDPPCDEVTFEADESNGMWPSIHIMSHIANKIQALHETSNLSFPQGVALPFDSEFISRNAVKLHLFYKQLNHETITTSPHYDLSSFVADLGGQLGLWLGFSILTLLELIELLVDICIMLVTRSKSQSVTPSTK